MYSHPQRLSTKGTKELREQAGSWRKRSVKATLR